MRIKIGDLLVKAGVITELQLKAALAEQQQWGGKLGDILVRMEFVTEEVLVRALSKQTGIARADLTGEADQDALQLVPADTAEEFGVVPVAVKDQGRTLVVAMSDPLNISATDHVKSLTGGKKIETLLAGNSAIRSAISRWYRGEELLESEQHSMRIVNNSGESVVTVGKQARGNPPSDKIARPPSDKIARPPSDKIVRPPSDKIRNGSAKQSATDVLRGLEETQRRSVAALKAMVELLIEKGVFSRDEYLARVKR